MAAIFSLTHGSSPLVGIELKPNINNYKKYETSSSSFLNKNKKKKASKTITQTNPYPTQNLNNKKKPLPKAQIYN